MKTKMRSCILLGALILILVFGMMALLPQALNSARAFDPAYLEFFKSPEDSTLSILSKDDELDAEIDARGDSGGFSIIKTGLSVSTSNLAGYTLFVAPVGVDHDGNITNRLVNENPQSRSGIKSLGESVTVSRKVGGDSEEVWDMTNFPNNSWGVGVINTGELQVFRPVSVDGTKIKTTDLPKDGDETTAIVGVKAGKGMVSGNYSNTLEFTAVANPIPYIYTLEYDANGGLVPPKAETVTKLNQASCDFTVTDVVPMRLSHSTGDYVFLGWSEDKEASVPDIIAGNKITLNVSDPSTQATRTVRKVLYAIWQKTYNYALGFDSGTDDPVDNMPKAQETTSTGNAAIVIPSNIPTRTGYNFSGYTDGIRDYSPGDTYEIPLDAGETNPIAKTLIAKWTPKRYTVSIVNSDTNTGDATSVAVPYDGSETLEVTPDVGHYLSSVVCSEGYTCTGYDLGTDETEMQTITITNNKTVDGGTIGFGAGLSEYEVAIAPNLNAVLNTNSLSVPYGKSKTFTLTPINDYYLGGVKCADGYTCTGYTLGNNSVARNTQVITVTNDNTPSDGAVSFAVSEDTPLSTIDYMQDVTPKVVLDTEIGESKTLVDKRDGKSYLVAKLKDGKIWMAQDLTLGGDGDMVLTPEDSNVLTNFTLKVQNTGTWCTDASLASCTDQSMMVKTGVPNGYLYNWYTATAGTGKYDSTIDDAGASSSICPKGWSLPRGGANAVVGNEFYYLAQQYGMTSPGTNQTAYNNLMAKPFPAFNYTGYRSGGSTGETNSLSYYWSRTSGNHINVYSQRMSGNAIRPADLGNTKNAGYAVRCVASAQLRIENSNTTSSAFGVDVMTYGEIKSVTVNPINKDYYLSKVECPEGYTCSGYYTDREHAGQQTVKVRNDGTSTTGILKFIASPISECSASTPVGSVCMYGSSKVDAVKLRDGRFWAKRALAAPKWTSLDTISCPAGMNKPTAEDYRQLIYAYGGYSNTGYGSPYGANDPDADIRNATGWTGAFWATTQYDSSRGWRFYLYDSSTVLSYANKTDTNQIGCYGT